MVTQSTKPEDLVEEILLDYNEEVFNNLRKTIKRKFTRKFFGRWLCEKNGKKRNGAFPTRQFDFRIRSRKNNMFNVFTALEVEDGILYKSNMCFCKVPIRYKYKSKTGKGAVMRDGFEYILIPPKTDRLYIISPHFLDRLVQRSIEFNRTKKRYHFTSDIQTFSFLSIRDKPAFYQDNCSDVKEDVMKEFLELYGEEDEVKEYMEKGDVPAFFLDGYAIIKKSDANQKLPGVVKTFIYKRIEDMSERELHLLELIESMPHRTIPVF